MNQIEIDPPIGTGIPLIWKNKQTIREIAIANFYHHATYYSNPTGHQLFHSRAQDALAWLLKEYRSTIDLIYLDPPFASQAKYHQRIDTKTKAVQYNDHWDENEYLQFIFVHLLLLRMLLSDKGTIYLHCDHRQSHHIRMIMDEVFGAENFLNHIVWSYKTGGVPEKKGFSKKHDDILVYSKSTSPIFNRQYQKSYAPSLPEPHTPSGQKLGVKRDPFCELCQTGNPGPKYRNVVCRDVWMDIPTLFRNDIERTNYPTQKPEALLRRIIAASSTTDSIVLDPFCGSGTTLAAANSLGRRSIGIDQNAVAIQCSIARLQTSSINSYRQANQSASKCEVSFVFHKGELRLVSYKNSQLEELDPKKWLKSIWIDTNPSNLFRPTIAMNPSTLVCSLEATSGNHVRIEVVDLRGAMWSGLIDLE